MEIPVLCLSDAFCLPPTHPQPPMDIPKPPLPGRGMAIKVQLQLAYYLELLKKEELKEFHLQLGNTAPLGSSSETTPASSKKPSGKALVAENVELQTCDLDLHSGKQMHFSVCAQDTKPPFWMAGHGFSYFGSPSTPNMTSPSWPTSTAVLELTGPESLENPLNSDRRILTGLSDMSGHPMRENPSYQALPSSPDHESPNQESPNPPTATAMLGS
ncbi:NACHT, LRR and PYD domains-containing protein 1-like isoform X1 [Heterocephalus glaber]|nr:NACHT, LRR and PYD domains-containing protein 1-like isoform X1 [Heterocephalus glaber]